MWAVREGFDLFNPACRHGLWLRIKRQDFRGVRRYIFRDTFTRWICWLSGGHEFSWQPDPVNEPEERFCHWCHRLRPEEPPNAE